jgi:phosphate:Na+ symporter
MVIVFDPFMLFVEKVIGPGFELLSGLFKFSPKDDDYAIVGFEIAAAHSLFNITNVLLFIPFIPQLARLTERLRPDSGLQPKQRLKLLGDVSQVSPELALRQAHQEVALACEVTSKLFGQTAAFLDASELDPAAKSAIDHAEGVTDNIQKEVTIFLTTVLQMQVTPNQASRAYALLRLADEVESVADYCQALSGYHVRLLERGEQFTPEARTDLKALFDGIRALFEAAAERVADGEDRVQIDDLLARGNELSKEADAIREGHLERIKAGQCEALAGLTFSDMVVALRRIKNHSINMLEAHNSSWESRLEALKVLDVVRRNSRVPGGATPSKG